MTFPGVAEELPTGGPVRLENATVAEIFLDAPISGATPDSDGLLRCDIDIEDGRVVRIEAPGTAGPAGEVAANAVDLDGGMVWPCFVDAHTHLDKGHIWPRQPNPDGTREGALSSTDIDQKANWSAEDVRARMQFSLQSAYAHGTAAIRTHIDSYPPQEAISWPVFADLRDEWAGRIDLQGSFLATLDHYRDEDAGNAAADLVAAYGSILGAVCWFHDGIDALLDRVIRLAMERELDLDFHVDERADPNANSFDHIAEALIRNNFGRPVVVGHCCSLAQRPAEEVDRALDLAADADMRPVSLPMCNMYLQGREAGRTPRWRGVTVLHEMKARGIPVSIASDNTRDPFHAYGDLDGLEVFSQAVRIAHLDHPIGDWPAAITRTPADAMGLSERGRISVGKPADLVLFRARDYSELIPRRQADRIVLRGGAAIDGTLPDYRELDTVIGRS